ncbi:esterase-like activity of phytase family protein [Marinovum sp.]|uniref:esterase-like activity of phytase family protein n=1 Tax=Marinovum sp. TaxID=2024839 RepID=UPI002B272D27|nr:esterase-like activity of phytase family protein [Marinovum sp.]
MTRFLRAACLGLAGLAGGCIAAETPPQGRHVQSFSWRSEAPGFGGFSGIELAEDGESFVAISDRGAFVEGRLIRKNGRITGIEASAPQPLMNTDGKPMHRKVAQDAEGLAITADGRRYISFEGRARVWAYPDMARAKALPEHPDFTGLQRNSSLEALAVDSRGWLYTLPERSGQMTRPFPVYRFNGTRWDQPFSIPRLGGFQPTGADIGPDGMFYLLEREFTGLGFRSRVRRFALTADALGPGETLLESHLARHDNLEGLSVTRTATGQIRLTMVSDDNFNPFQRGEIVEYVLP